MKSSKHSSLLRQLSLSSIVFSRNHLSQYSNTLSVRFSYFFNSTLNSGSYCFRWSVIWLSMRLYNSKSRLFCGNSCFMYSLSSPVSSSIPL
eukprot:UN09659